MESQKRIRWFWWNRKTKKDKIVMGGNFENKKRIRRICNLREKPKKIINWAGYRWIAGEDKSSLDWRWKTKRRNISYWRRKLS
jgi:hypothetical protein